MVRDARSWSWVTSLWALPAACLDLVVHQHLFGLLASVSVSL